MANKFVVATEGATTDGREIKAEWLQQMAATYDQKKYGARLNCEHIRGIVPNGSFSAFGDVLSLETGKNDEGKTTLIAEIDPTEELKSLVKARQKIYTSCEIDPNFADTGIAYLVGLAVTDSPASLGTEMLKFSSTLPDDKKPLSYMKRRPENVISEPVEMPQKLSTDNEPGILARVKSLLTRNNRKTEQLSHDSAEVQEALELLATENAELREKIDQLTSADEMTQLKKQVSELSDMKVTFDGLIKQLDSEPAQGFTQRPAATGVVDDNIDY